MTTSTGKLTLRQREQRAYAAARRLGLALRKSSSRTPELPAWGTYMLVDTWTNSVVAYGLSSGFGLTIDDVEDELRERGATSIPAHG